MVFQRTSTKAILATPKGKRDSEHAPRIELLLDEMYRLFMCLTGPRRKIGIPICLVIKLERKLSFSSRAGFLADIDLPFYRTAFCPGIRTEAGHAHGQRGMKLVKMHSCSKRKHRKIKYKGSKQTYKENGETRFRMDRSGELFLRQFREKSPCPNWSDKLFSSPLLFRQRRIEGQRV